MKTFKTIQDLRHEIRNNHDSLAIVPTMGALHPGHLSLVKIARQKALKVGVSIFVNPMQFNNPSDLKHYPRDLDKDLQLLQEVGVDYVFTPTEEVMYGIYNGSKVIPSKLAQVMEGPNRPGHFDGVCTVVAMLFNVFQADAAVFGEKDFQQLRIIEDMVRDLKFDIDIVRAPISREDNGLARSSRNELLTASERAGAQIIYKALSASQAVAENGERSARMVLAVALKVLETYPDIRLEYLSINRGDDLIEAETIEPGTPYRIFFAGNLGKVRLIDNIAL